LTLPIAEISGSLAGKKNIQGWAIKPVYCERNAVFAHSGSPGQAQGFSNPDRVTPETFYFFKKPSDMD